MKINDIIQGIKPRKTWGEIDREISDFHFDSRKVEQDQGFVAVRGTQTDGHAFIEIALQNGAKLIVAETEPVEGLDPTVCWVRVPDTSAILGKMAANFYGHPAERLTLVGITGTNGKTSTATLLYQLFQRLGFGSGLIGTAGYRIGKAEYPASHTTPDPKQLHALFARMIEEGCEYCFMEVSSHALAQGRVRDIPFRVGVFTNITHDHLDYHGSFAEYIKAKKKLFDLLPEDAIALINLDDRNARIMVQNTAAEVVTYACKRPARHRARLIENTFEGLLLEIDGREAWFRLLGAFNAYNLLAAYSVAVALGIEAEETLRGLSALQGAAGRFQAFRAPSGTTAVVDYAHTPDALQNVLSTLVDVLQDRGKIVTVVGCGGNRDREKRPKMAAIAAKLSDQVILTSDNPRNEDPEQIIREMEAGLTAEMRRKVLSMVSRREAIRTAVRLADPEDVVLVAGKGHETYQEIGGERLPFDDRAEIRSAFAELG